VHMPPGFVVSEVDCKKLTLDPHLLCPSHDWASIQGSPSLAGFLNSLHRNCKSKPIFERKQKKGSRQPAGTLKQYLRRSKVQLPSELKHSGIERRGHLSKVAGAQPIADRVELSVVPDVEAFRAQFEPASLVCAEGEALEER
jgi:hypothetical protein